MPYLMKGKHWSERSTFRRKLQYPVFVEPKADEIRVHVRVDVVAKTVQYMSYAEKPLYNLEFANHAFLEAAQFAGVYEFDCGFSCNDSFDDSRSYVRSSKNFPQRLRSAKLLFYVYDLPTSPLPYMQRRCLIDNLVGWCECSGIEHLVQLPAYLAGSEADVLQFYTEFRELGYEGAMVKGTDHLYQLGRRSQDWLKIKPEETADGKIIGVVEAVATVDNPATGVIVGDPLGRVGSVIVRMEDGSEARPHGIPHELGRTMLLAAELYIGEWCEFAFMERDTQGGYRHPVFRRIRDAKD